MEGAARAPWLILLRRRKFRRRLLLLDTVAPRSHARDARSGRIASDARGNGGRTLALALRSERASQTSFARRPLGTTSRSAARHCCSLDERSRLRSSLDGPLTCELDDKRQYRHRGLGSNRRTVRYGSWGAGSHAGRRALVAIPLRGRGKSVALGRAGDAACSSSETPGVGSRFASGLCDARVPDRCRVARDRGAAPPAPPPRTSPRLMVARLAESGVTACRLILRGWTDHVAPTGTSVARVAEFPRAAWSRRVLVKPPDGPQRHRPTESVRPTIASQAGWPNDRAGSRTLRATPVQRIDQLETVRTDVPKS